MNEIIRRLARLDRRWIFLLMAIAVMIPVITKSTFPEKPTPLVQAVFDKIENLPEGSKILLAFDYDPGSAPELQPMATAWVWHCCKKKHKLYFMALWPLGPQMIQETVDAVIKRDFPEYKYGEDYVNLGYKSGNEGVIRVVVSNMRELFLADANGTPLTAIPMTRDLSNIREMSLILNASAGYPGAKEWVQYAATPYAIPLAAGSTGVQTPNLYPYIPNQMFGLLGAIKGAAEYEAALRADPKYKNEYGLSKEPPKPGEARAERPEYLQGIQRMGPQLIAHCLILALIVLGNVVLAMQGRTREGA